MMFSPSTTVQALLDGGKLKALAVTSAKRSKFFPIVPTVAESGRPGWSPAVRPAGTGENAGDRRQAQQSGGRDHGRQGCGSNTWPSFGAEPEPQTPDAFARYINADVAKWSALVKEQGIVIPGAGK